MPTIRTSIIGTHILERLGMRIQEPRRVAAETDRELRGAEDGCSHKGAGG
jgi:hypothetical protein